ncbi:RNA polymerase sigma factor [Abyssibacter profundi]|uniref:RNA polymerase sigma factor n=1 Tax=Abyssibacter profundi TaxID=2182787 RepID=UPI001402B1A9|nr:sigma-70 family RNA polymerase sigma factor [Abyssibacter profundi]
MGGSGQAVPQTTDTALEAELLRRVAARDEEAFEALYRIYHRRLSRFLMRLTPDYAIAEEVINDTMHIVWDKAEQYDGRAKVSTWIFGIGYRRGLKALERQRTRNRYEEAAARDRSTISEPVDETAREDEGQWIDRGLQQLSTEHRMALELAYVAGHSCEEIAAIVGCPVNTVKTRLFHARKRLRARLPNDAGGGS